MSYWKTPDGSGTAVSDDPIDGWEEIDQSEYDLLVASITDANVERASVHSDIHTLITELSLTPAAASALHRLHGVGH